MRASKQRTEKRQEQIAQATLDIIAEQGMPALSVAAVAQRVGIVPSGLYRHYRDKEALIDAALDAIASRHTAGLKAADQPPNRDAVDRLERLFIDHLEMITASVAIPRIVFSRDIHAGHHGRRAKLLKIVNGFLDHIAAIIVQGQREGCLRRDMEPAAAARLFFGLIQPAAFLWNLSDGMMDVKTQAKAAWPLFLRATKAEKGTTR